MIPAGTIHALGPGLLVYEVQETRISPTGCVTGTASQSGRTLHIEQSIRVIDPDLRPQIFSAGDQNNVTDLVSCEYFKLEKMIPEMGDIRH